MKFVRTVLSFIICSILLALIHTSGQALPLISPDVLIDVGHGGIDGGTHHNGWIEKDINLAMARVLKQTLTEHGIQTTMNRWSDIALSDDNHWLRIRSRHLRDLAQRKLIIDQLQPKIIVSLHCNWSPKSSTYGPITLYQANQQSFMLALLIQRQLNSIYHSAHRSASGKAFYILKHAPRPTVIVEMGFISNPFDLKMLTSEKSQRIIAEAITTAISEYLYVYQVVE